MKHFPADFIWGTATSSYQIEGASDVGGKGPSIWDAFSRIPGRVQRNENGDLACDHYHLFREDVQLMKQLGVNAYRFSIAWSRILPDGSTRQINEAGIQFYNELIDELLANGITPWVTLYHWDLPLALEMEKDGWLNPQITDTFADYATLCFEHFGDRVKNWITLNEPWVVSILGYGQGVFAPGRVSNTEPYLAAHHLLLAHAKAVAIYRKRFLPEQQGQIGMSNNCDWREPLTDSSADQEAAQRALEFFVGWFADPIYLGRYPQCMIDRLGDRLPTFTPEERTLLKGSSDFFGLNHYTTMYAADSNGKLVQTNVYGNGGLSEDQDVILQQDPSWEKTSMGWAIVPWGCKKLLHWLDQRYDHPPIVITENGGAFPDKYENGQVDDQDRVAFVKGYLEACHEAIQEGVSLKAYMLWSFMDNFEWASGYSQRFGIHYVDFSTLERVPKASALWYRKVIAQNGISEG